MIRVGEGVRLHVLEWGASDAFPVVILHGGGHSAAHWDEVCARLSGELRCIVPDQRGHGDSDWAPDGDYACATQVADIERLLETLDVSRCALVGHSMGGLNALLYAGTHPDQVEALVLVDVGTDTRDTGLQRTRRRAGRAPRVKEILTGAEALSAMKRRYPRRDRDWLERQRAREMREVEPEKWRPKTDLRFGSFVSTYCGDREERRRLLVAAATRVLVLRGEHSRIMTPEGAAVTAGLVDGQVAEVPGAGHGIPLDNPEGAALALLRFLRPLVQSAA
jgi:pimeloyl-ACP methyl ester carboxylesterase